ncbi:N(2)-fixation sustaining protein CowN [Arcobacter sp. FWKO B]|uniref:N(2)-fixation sustaining protein CowN n=1 Tax=Arcobacter sp. FWKO B TaxID=2593672 RepID=UPI0018A41733|nr:N(2)-fixation sustaining protein CowN [Arcobacter sp. FWKO B]QOG11691.1 N(2)-fixation sustaining protein CowN [Arcobacter sp. FWKO B]
MNTNRDRYITFSNIDCYQNAIEVLDCMFELFNLYPEAKNDFWIRFENQLPNNYKSNYCKEGCLDILYLVCSNVFYISDLFDEYDFEKGIDILQKAELECC